MHCIYCLDANGLPNGLHNGYHNGLKNGFQNGLPNGFEDDFYYGGMCNGFHDCESQQNSTKKFKGADKNVGTNTEGTEDGKQMEFLKSVASLSIKDGIIEAMKREK